MIAGQEKAVEQFLAAWRSGSMHHAWLLAGPRGVGKASFAMAAAERVLAEAAGPPVTDPGIETPKCHPVGRLVAAGSHPDFRLLERLENERTGNLARNISVDQVRDLGELFAMTPALSPWRQAFRRTSCCSPSTPISGAKRAGISKRRRCATGAPAPRAARRMPP